MVGPEVSVVLAAYDEGPSIAAVVEGCLRHLPPSAEVIVVDDGSRDDTAALAAGAGARVIRLSTNRGKGTALRRGAHEATGSWLVFLDADGQDDPADIPRLLDAARGGAELVIGSRFLGRFEAYAITPLHDAGNRALTWVVNALFATALTDTQAGFRVLARATFLGCELAATGYDVEVDVLLEVLRQGGAVQEVPVTRHARAHGRSHLRSLRDGSRILSRILRQRLKRSPSDRGRSSGGR